MNKSGEEYIYMAIRRPNKPASEFEPEELFNTVQGESTITTPSFNLGFSPDMAWEKAPSGGGDHYIGSRLQGAEHLLANEKNAAVRNTNITWDHMNGWIEGFNGSNNYNSWGFKRAPGFFDTVCYEGNGQATHELPHNLGTYPEMAWVKARDGAYPWPVYCKYTHPTATNQNYRLDLSTDAYRNGGSSYFPFATSPDSFPVGSATHVNKAGIDYTAYLFASVPGICDIGSYTGTGNTIAVNCGFTTGVRFVLIKRTDAAGDWMYFDTLRGISSGLNPMLKLNTADAQESVSGVRQSASGRGFDATNETTTSIRDATYIYMAIA